MWTHGGVLLHGTVSTIISLYAAISLFADAGAIAKGHSSFVGLLVCVLLAVLALMACGVSCVMAIIHGIALWRHTPMIVYKVTMDK